MSGTSDEERELRRRLAPGPAPKPPEGLLEKLKADIPERLPANVRPMRPRAPVTLLRIAAMLFVFGGALFLVTHLPNAAVAPEDAAPARAATKEEAAPPKPAAPPVPAAGNASAPASQEERQAAAPPPPRARRAAEPPAKKDAVRAAAEPPAPLGQAPAPPAAAAPQDALSRPAPQAGFAPAMPSSPETKREIASQRLQEGTSDIARHAEKSSVAATSRAPQIAPTPGSLLAAVLGQVPASVAAADGDQVLLLFSIPPGGEPGPPGAAPLTVLSAASAPGGSLVVLAKTRAVAPGIAVAPSLESAGAELKLAVLAWRLERARAAGDDEARAAVARDASTLARTEARAATLERLAMH